MQVTGNKPTYHNLSIRVKADGFSFLVTEGHSGDILLCEEFTPASAQPLHELLAEKLRLPVLEQYDFARVRVITFSDATCIPRKEFVAEELAQTYSVVFPQIDESLLEVCYTHLPQLDIVQAFTISRAVRQVVTEVYPDASFTNASAVVLGRIATYCKRQQVPDNALFAYTTPRQLFLFSICGDELRFANSFPLDQPKDSLYFLLSVWKTLDFNARRQQCYIAGEKDSVDFLASEARNYLQHVHTMSLTIEY